MASADVATAKAKATLIIIVVIALSMSASCHERTWQDSVGPRIQSGRYRLDQTVPVWRAR